MKIYAINLCTDTKNTDRYDKVAVNKYPMIVKCKGNDELKEFLSKDETVKYVKDLLKQKHLYETAVYYIREIGENIIEDRWVVKDITFIDYEKDLN